VTAKARDALINALDMDHPEDQSVFDEVRAKARDALIEALLEEEYGEDELAEIKSKAREALMVALDDEQQEHIDQVKATARSALLEKLGTGREETTAREKSAATKIQAVHRGRATRRSFLGSRYRTEIQRPIKCGAKNDVHSDVQDTQLLLPPLLAKISCSDRRIGELTAHIAETRALIQERAEECQQLEANLTAARATTLTLENDISVRKKILSQADRTLKGLKASKKQLTHHLEDETLRQKHADLDVALALFSPRPAASTMSTTCSEDPFKTPRWWGGDRHLLANVTPGVA